MYLQTEGISLMCTCRLKGAGPREHKKEPESDYGLEGDAAELEKESAQVRQELEQMFDTERMKAAWRNMVTPKKTKKHIAMATTSAEAVLRRQGQQVGLFFSPFLESLLYVLICKMV